ncbi:hypothetical protein [Streptomyces sp. NPDC001530]|uniref:hypothetical protein n=1 Tax=Streptomyces sp. NPDC001530 TaxID=3364582 RepID=UPI00368E0D7C
MTAPAERSRINFVRFHNARQSAARNDREILAAAIDHARAVAAKAVRDGDTRALHSLAEAIHAWTVNYEASRSRSSSSPLH